MSRLCAISELRGSVRTALKTARGQRRTRLEELMEALDAEFDAERARLRERDRRNAAIKAGEIPAPPVPKQRRRKPGSTAKNPEWVKEVWGDR